MGGSKVWQVPSHMQWVCCLGFPVCTPSCNETSIITYQLELPHSWVSINSANQPEHWCSVSHALRISVRDGDRKWEWLFGGRQCVLAGFWSCNPADWWWRRRKERKFLVIKEFSSSQSFVCSLLLFGQFCFSLDRFGMKRATFQLAVAFFIPQPALSL